MGLVPQHGQYVVAALANVVVDGVIVFAGVLGLHLLAGAAWMVETDEQDAGAYIDLWVVMVD